MEKEELKKLDTEALNKKLANNKFFGWLMLSASIAILILLGEQISRTGEINYLEFIIPLCSLASLPFLWREIKTIKAELAERK